MALVTGTKDGRPLYRVRWNYRRDPVTGKRSFDERVFRKRQEARAFERRVTSSTTTATERITVAGAAEAWMDRHASVKAKRTNAGYRTEVDRRITPGLGGKRISTLTALDVAEWLSDIAAIQSPATANKALRTLKAMNRWARSAGISENRVIDDVRPLEAPRPAPARAYTPDEVERIANGCDLLRDRTLVLVAAYSGLRWGELVVLEWADVHLDDATIVARHALDLGGTRKAPKSGKARPVAVLAPGVEALRMWSEHSSGSGLVFPSRAGTPLGSSWYRPTGPLGRARKASGIRFEPHQLRDTYASILIATGDVSEMELSMVLGHESLQTTKRHYAEQYDKRRAQIATKANRILKTL